MLQLKEPILPQQLLPAEMVGGGFRNANQRSVTGRPISLPGTTPSQGPDSEQRGGWLPRPNRPG
jgi:hypothetical protein